LAIVPDSPTPLEVGFKIDGFAADTREEKVDGHRPCCHVDVFGIEGLRNLEVTRFGRQFLLDAARRAERGSLFEGALRLIDDQL
jgi:hypothetical protein